MMKMGCSHFQICNLSECPLNFPPKTAPVPPRFNSSPLCSNLWPCRCLGTAYQLRGLLTCSRLANGLGASGQVKWEGSSVQLRKFGSWWVGSKFVVVIHTEMV